MLKIIPMLNPFELAFSSYNMTGLGKVLFGSMIAETAINAYENSNRQPMQHQSAPTYSDPVQETWAFYGQVLQTINNKPNLVDWWNNLSVKNKKNAIVEVFCKEGKGHLVPFLQKHIFPTIG